LTFYETIKKEGLLGEKYFKYPKIPANFSWLFVRKATP
jgi:hypothetical protein